MKKAYLTEENFQQKKQTWRKDLAPFSKHWKKFAITKSALIVIDLQNYFLDPKSHAFIPSAQTILPQIHTSIEFFRKAKMPIFYTRFAVKNHEKDPIGSWWNSNVEEGSSKSKLFAEICPLPNETVFRKTHYNAFLGTTLLKNLKETIVDSVLICGLQTHLCCESTARAAFEEGFKVFMLADGTASSTESLHIHSLQTLSLGFATPLFSDDL